MVKFKEFKIGELFETNPYRDGRQVLTGGNVPAKKLKPGNTPRISVTSKNNGVIGYYEDVDMNSYRVFENAISVSFLGTVFYHPYRASYDMKVHCLRLKDHELSECEALYLVSVLKKLVSVYNYSNQLSSTEIVELVIPIPVKPSADDVNYTQDDIDWDYMESYIHELEESYIHELEESYIHELDVYLKETGLDDYRLTDAERDVLGRAPVFKEFKVGELFEGTSGDKDLKKEHLDGAGYPVITAGIESLGVAGYSSAGAKIFTANTLTVDMFGNCYFRPFKYKMVTHARVFSLSLKDGSLTTETGLFICTLLKWLTSKYNYSNMCSYNKIKEETLKIPIKPDTDETNYSASDIDWDYMESYIRATEKEVIADVVEYKNAVIENTKNIVSGAGLS